MTVHGIATDGVYFDEVDLTPYANTWGVTLDGDTAETSAFGSPGNAKEYIRGLSMASVNLAGFWESSTDAAPISALSGDGAPITVIPEAQAIGGVAYTGKVLSTSYNPGADLGGATAFSLAAQGSPFGRGVLLSTKTPITTTGRLTSVDNLVSSPDGGVATFHFITDDVTSITVAIQDSADDAVFANLSEQTYTVESGDAVVVPGTIDRYLAFNVSAFTGTSAVIVASFVRL
jgi:hypothetical protein